MNEDTITGEVTTLAFGGQGLLRHENLVVFLPFTAPGDQVSGRIRERKKNFALADVVSYTQLGPSRITPKCPFFGICGGCQLQHLDYAVQLDHKRQWVEDALKRIGQLAIDPIPAVVPAQEQWGYRRHISLTLKPGNLGFEAGYIACDNLNLVQVQQCPIFDDSSLAITHVKEITKSLIPASLDSGKVSLFKNGNGIYLLDFQFKWMPKNSKVVFNQAMNSSSHWSGISARAGDMVIEIGQTIGEIDIEGLKFEFSPKAFIQNHPEQSLNIYRMIVDRSKNAKSILDLYCGIGISTLLLAAQGKKCIGVEGNPIAIDLARKNGALNSLANAEFIQADIKSVVKKLLRKQRPDLVIVNPPRTGLDQKILNDLLSNPPAELLYISCMPPTLARDLRLLCNEIYKFDFCQPFDMFPQTSHVETLVHLKRG